MREAQQYKKDIKNEEGKAIKKQDNHEARVARSTGLKQEAQKEKKNYVDERADIESNRRPARRKTAAFPQGICLSLLAQQRREEQRGRHRLVIDASFLIA